MKFVCVCKYSIKRKYCSFPQGENDKAQQLWKHCLDVCENAPTDEHQNIVQILKNLASVMQAKVRDNVGLGKNYECCKIHDPVSFQLWASTLTIVPTSRNMAAGLRAIATAMLQIWVQYIATDHASSLLLCTVQEVYDFRIPNLKRRIGSRARHAAAAYTLVRSDVCWYVDVQLYRGLQRLPQFPHGCIRRHGPESPEARVIVR